MGDDSEKHLGCHAVIWPVRGSRPRRPDALSRDSSPRVFGADAVTVERGWQTATAYLTQPAVRVVTPGPGHAAIAAELATTPGLRSDDVPDLELAALAIEHGLVLASHDHGFRRFAQLRSVDPLERADG